MKKITLIVPLLLIACLAKAQIVNIDTVSTVIRYNPDRKNATHQEYMYSIGIKLLSIQEMPKFLKQVDPSKLYNSSFSGVLLKINDNQISYRLFGDYYNKNHSFINECSDCEIVSGKLTDYSLKIGFEKKLTYSRLQPYFGFDLGYRGIRFKGKSEAAGATGFTNPYDVVNQKNGIAFTPILGFKFNITDQITLGAESAIDLLYSYETQEKMYRDAPRTRTFEKYNKWEFLPKPLNILYLQYNLGSIN